MSDVAEWSMLPWHSALWDAMNLARSQLPHACLFVGQPGIGKVAFARHLGASLLCERPEPGGHACGQCPSCGWIAAACHPDYILVRPDAVGLVEKARQAIDDDALSEESTLGEGEDLERKAKHAPSKEIRIDQIRALADTLAVSSHRGGLRVVILYPAQAMNVYTANALLKILEEPPPLTVLFLVAESIERLLPTVVSRCQKFTMVAPDHAQATSWLRARQIAEGARFLAEAGGAPLAAEKASQLPPEIQALQAELFSRLGAPAKLAELDLCEALGKCDLPLVVGWVQRWVYDCLGYRLAGRIRYYPSYKERIVALASACDPKRLHAYARLLLADRRVADHPLSGRLFVENLLLAYVDAIHGPLSP